MALRVLVYVRIYKHKHLKVELVVLNNIVVLLLLKGIDEQCRQSD